MKIFQVLNHFLPDQTAGTEVYVCALSKQLQKKGIEVKIIIPNYGNAISELYIYDGLQVFKFAETSTVDRALIMGHRDADGLSFFTKFIEEQRPDIVHFHELAGSNGISLKHVMAAKKIGAHVLFTFHLAGYSCKTGTLIYKDRNFCNGKIDINKCGNCYLQHKGYGRLKALLNPISQLLYLANWDTTKWNSKIGTGLGTSFLIANQKKNFHLLIDQCDKVIVLTKFFEQVLLLNDVSKAKIKFIPQALAHSFKKEATKPSVKVGSPLRLMFLGRISSLKGLHLLIDAILDLPKTDVVLDIYGQTGNVEYEQTLKQKSQHFNNITWCGKLEPRSVLHTMHKYDVLCLCSTICEMSPLVIQEAFAAGIPVLASNVYGNAEQITHGKNGWLFKFNDSNDLREKISSLVQNPSLLSEVKKNIGPVKSFETVGEEHQLLYTQILQ